MLRYSVIILTLCCSLTAAAVAEDLYAPTWRRSAATTFQSWTFSTSSNKPAPTTVSNPYGTPSAAVNVGATGGWINSNTAYGNRTGYWSLGPSAIVTITIPNQIAASKVEDVWVQLVWAYVLDSQGGTGRPQSVSVDGVATSTAQSTALESNSKCGWFSSVYKLQLNPSVRTSQTVTIKADTTRGYLLDQVLIDTKLSNMMPEPSSLAVLLMGVLGLAISRRKRR